MASTAEDVRASEREREKERDEREAQEWRYSFNKEELSFKLSVPVSQFPTKLFASFSERDFLPRG